MFLLVNKLDSSSPTLHTIIHFNFVSSSSLGSSFQQISYFTVCIPLYFVFIILICLSFGSSRGNSWWFGLRKDFATFLLSTCPCLKTYANISYNKQSQVNGNSIADNSSAQLEQQLDIYKNKLKNQPKNNVPVMPSLTLDQPDW